MNEWITDRRPTIDDVPPSCDVVFDSQGRVVFSGLIAEGEPWMPITPPEPYVKPKLQRYIVVPGKRDDRFLELQECEAAFDSAVCMSDDVKHIEAINARLLEALEYAVNIYGRFGAVVNEPHNPGEWIEQARAAIAKAKGEQP